MYTTGVNHMDFNGDKMKTEIKLDANMDTGEGQIRIMPHFETMNMVWKLDMMNDWICELQREYNKRVDIWEEELDNATETISKNGNGNTG